ncbi:MAG: tyrosine-type recombinase/integrase [Muribaculaceae bacterium]|nr:tyrosine-type recombinase/integrase [Muribaculaceae bacterium]
MYEIKVLKDGVLAIQKHLSSEDHPYDPAKAYFPACRALEMFYQTEGEKAYSPAVNLKFREHIDRQVEQGMRSERSGRLYRRLAFMIDDYYSGRPFKDIYSSGKRYKYKLDPSAELLIENFKNSLDLSSIVIPCAGTIARSFFYYLHQNSLLEEQEISEETIVGFLQFKSTENKSSMDSVLYFLRKLLLFLSDNGIYTVNPAIASYKAAACRRKVLPAFENSEIEALLNAPDRSKPAGKRDYAILILASFTGIRAIDIANLTFENIRKGEGAIAFSQHKTARANAVPVNKKVMDALYDYIANARPESPLPYIFLTMHRPYRKLNDCSSVRSIFNRHFRASGLEKTSGDGKSFHAFRRTVGKWLLESSADAQMISQVLGQHDRDVLKRYLPLSPDTLRECALDFTLVPLRTGVYQ